MSDPTLPPNISDSERPTAPVLPAETGATETSTHDAVRVEALREDPALNPKPRTALDTDVLDSDGDDQLRVQWVRPTDLAARAGARLMEKGVETNQHHIDLVRQAALETGRTVKDRLRRALARREQDLTPDAPTTAAAPALGRQGVSR